MLLATHSTNPLIPNPWESGWIWLGIAMVVISVALFIAALVSIVRTRHSSTVAQALWIVIVLAFPALGPVLWFVVGRRTAAQENLQRRDSFGSPAPLAAGPLR